MRESTYNYNHNYNAAVIKPLTSLRFIFAFMIFLGHFILFEENEYPFLNFVLHEGNIAMCFFFTLSGFILSYNYQQRLIEGQPIEKKIFFVSRFARIYPLHIFTLLLWLWIYKGGPFDSSFITNFLLNITLLQSFFPIEGIKFNAVSWSLSDELFFYLLFPFIVFWAVKHWRSFIIFFSVFIVIIIIASGLLSNHTLSKWIFYTSPYLRLADFTIGVLLFNICKSGKLDKWREKLSPTLLEVSVILLLIGVLCASFYLPVVLSHAICYWLPISFFIFVFYYQSGRISKFLSKRYWMLLGEISFSFFMLHTFIIWYTRRLVAIFDLDVPLFGVFLFAVLTTIFVSFFSFKYLETPFYNKIKRFFLSRSK